MRVLILATDYPRLDGYIQLMYIHIRNIYYLENYIDVTVLNFKADDNYTIDGVKVITLQKYNESFYEYDILISHAPNIRNHYMFIKKFEGRFRKLVLFFHGHEIVSINKVYPKSYEFIKKHNILVPVIQTFYDSFKLKVWKQYITNQIKKIHLVFVSENLYKEFIFWTKIDPVIIKKNFSIINNCIGKEFEHQEYDVDIKKEFEYITIRNNYDSSVYCIDLVVDFALKNPNKSFLVIGKGDYFKYHKKPENLILIEKYLQHKEMIDYINKSTCALMLTRRDTQGVMSCELASFGIPVITSDIPICHEMLDEFENVAYIDNKYKDISLNTVLDTLMRRLPYSKKINFFQEETCKKEVALLKRLFD